MQRANILDQLSSYNPNDLDRYIASLKNTINEQNELNRVLMKDDYEGTIQEMQNFLGRHETTITAQLEDITTYTKELKNIISANKTLQNDKEKYKEFVESEDYQNTATRLKEIKELKEDISLFLSQQGIVLSRF